MTTPASPPITMAQVRAEFGGTAGVTKLSAYVRGGAYVPNTGTNAGVPTSVPIRLNQLCGASAWALTASASPSTLYATRATAGTVVSGHSTVSYSGNSGAVSYLWSRVSGDAAIACSSTTNFSPTWSASVGPANPSRVAIWRCQVTDSVGSVFTNTVTITLEFNP
jgi:hypothetical protein